MQNILTEIDRCKQIEAVSKDRGLELAAAAYAGRRAALEWAVAELNRAPQPAPAAPVAATARPTPVRAKKS